WNHYSYADSDPVNKIDPSGHMPKWLKGILISAGSALVIMVLSYVATYAISEWISAGFDNIDLFGENNTSFTKPVKLDTEVDLSKIKYKEGITMSEYYDLMEIEAEGNKSAYFENHTIAQKILKNSLENPAENLSEDMIESISSEFSENDTAQSIIGNINEIGSNLNQSLSETEQLSLKKNLLSLKEKLLEDKEILEFVKNKFTTEFNNNFEYGSQFMRKYNSLQTQMKIFRQSGL
ncbi:hypothetical protein, partial [Cysteiniphilum marinum]